MNSPADWTQNNSQEASPSFRQQIQPAPHSAPLSLPVHSLRRRENVIQPPAITTSLSGLHFPGPPGIPSAGGLSFTTPISMSSPYLSSGMLSGFTTATSPMPVSARPRSFNSRYNPQEWGPISGSTSPVAAVGMVHQPPPSTSVNASPPPPPYSPPRANFRTQRAQSPHVGFSQASSPSPVAAPIQQNANVSQSRQRESVGYHYSTSRPGPSPVPTHERETVRSDHRTTFISAHTSVNGRSQPAVTDSSSVLQGHYVAGPAVGRGDALSGSIADTSHDVLQTVPPASRRAVSTGDIPHRGSNRASMQTDIHSSPRNGRWEPGMPLPPPPPGPPPATAPRRTSFSSQSLTERNHQPYSGGDRVRSGSGSSSLESNLPTIPATPLGWTPIEQSNAQAGSRRSSASPHDYQRSVPASPSLANTVPNNQQDIPQQVAPSSTRIQSQKGIRERRIQSRHNRTEGGAPGQALKDENQDMSWPSDLILKSPAADSGLVRRRTVTKATPRSARSNPGDEPLLSARSASSPFSNKINAISSPYSATPRLQSFSHDSLTKRGQTPPFSPGREQKSPALEIDALNLPPKALPTPPPAQHQDGKGLGLEPRSASSERPISHLLHLPVDVSPLEAQPLVPERLLARRPSLKDVPYAPIDEKFIQDAERRYHEYLAKEAAAKDPNDALQAFCDFIVAESGLRRQHYGSRWSNLTIDPKAIGEKLFDLRCNPLKASGRERSVGPSDPPQTPNRDTMQRRSSVQGSGIGNGYKPALSPIASMSMSNDESSRGRAPSRWWESQTGSDSGDTNGKLSRTKRETKYMGLPREMREAMQMDHLTPTQAAYDQQYSNNDQNPYANYGPNEYPPEKVNWHEPDTPQPPGPSRTMSAINREARKLDISRLVTLPPPYPRHYPGVNNNHPDMAYYRTTVRSISDLSELHNTKSSYEKKIKSLREQYQKESQEALREFRARMNQGIESGTISYAEAADLEAGRKAEANEKERKLVQAEFDSYQVDVLDPMQSILKDRIKIATACIDELQGKLFDSAQRQTPDQTQEEGDEEPELVEKLTQLKWLFDGRENLFREEYDILSERNEQFRAMVSLPYRQAKNTEKLTETHNFFIRDAQERKLAFVAETLKRFEGFMDVIEANVSRGVETQLSAFWDIAPPIVTILQDIPQGLEGFSVRIPQKEYDENPSYYQFPLQYLYSLVTHAGKSTYQFIESQTNLLCLLHEIKFGLMNANCKFMEVQRIISGELEENVRREMQESRSEEERILTLDLKEKVGMVEEQWTEALGQQLDSVKDRVRHRLTSEGGWEEMEQMEQS